MTACSRRLRAVTGTNAPSSSEPPPVAIAAGLQLSGTGPAAAQFASHPSAATAASPAGEDSSPAQIHASIEGEVTRSSPM
jgi:hypothetical protein